MKVITIAAQKGGTGKTTTAALLAQAAAYNNNKTLVIDLDTGNLSFIYGADRTRGTSYDLLTGTPAAEIIQKTAVNNLDIIPASIINSTITGGKGSANRLKNALQPLKRKYKYIIIDTPAGAGELQYNALTAADVLIIPVLCDILSIQALYQIAGTVQELQQTNKNLKAAGITANYDKRTTLANQMRESIADALQELNIINAGTVRTCSKIGEAVALQIPLFKYSHKCRAVQDYKSVFNAIEQLIK